MMHLKDPDFSEYKVEVLIRMEEVTQVNKYLLVITVVRPAPII